MLTFIGIVIILWLLWPTLKKWLAQYAANKTEDFLRKATGMPPRDKKRNHGNGAGRKANRKGNSGSPRAQNNEPLIPRDYAEDVEFIETVDYPETNIAGDQTAKEKTMTENQVSDAEFVEIK